MPKQGVVIVDGGDKRDAVTKLCFDVFERFAGEFPQIEVFTGIFFDGMEVDNEFVKDRASADGINHFIDVLL